MTTTLPDRRRGLILTLLGITILSPDGLLTTMIGADLWTALFWRGLLLGGMLILLTVAMQRGRFFAAVRAIGLPGLAIGALFAASSTGFVTAIRLSSVADTLFMVSAAPLFAAVISRLLGVPVSARTWLTIGVAVAGMFVIFAGQLDLRATSGVFAALGTAVAWGGMLVALERLKLADPTPAMAIGAFLMALPAIALAPTLSVNTSDYVPLALLGLLFLPVSMALISRGPRYLPAPEVGLILLLEAVLGPLLAFIVIAQRPSITTLLGGAIILLAVTAHFSVEIRSVRRSAT